MIFPEPPRSGNSQNLESVLELLPETAEIRDDVLWVGGCSTVELAEQYGTRKE